MNFVEIPFTLLPCGCVIATALRPEGDYVECYWCTAVFLIPDVIEWFRSTDRTVLLERPRVLVKADSRLWEIIDQCDDCGVPLVREKGARDLVHLSRLAGAEPLTN